MSNSSDDQEVRLKEEGTMGTSTHQLLLDGKRRAWSLESIEWAAQADVSGPLAKPDIIPEEIRRMDFWQQLPKEKQLAIRRGLIAWWAGLFRFGEALTVHVCEDLLEHVHEGEEKALLLQQLMDEIRHEGAFRLWLCHTFPDGVVLSDNEHLQKLENLLLSPDTKWHCKILGMNVLEVIADAAFGNLSKVITDPLLQDILRRVCMDEHGHVVSGRLELHTIAPSLSSDERKEMHEFLEKAFTLSLGRHLPIPVYAPFGASAKELEEIARAYQAGSKQRLGFERALNEGFESLRKLLND